MKKILFVVLLLLTMAFAFAEEFQIGTGTGTDYYVPTYGLYSYSHAKALYPASELATAGLNSPETLVALAFHVANSPVSYAMNNQYVYLRHTTDTSYASSPTVSTTTGYTQVFTGNLVYNGGGWFYVLFNEPFEYNGTSGLEVLWENHYGQWNSGYPTWTGTSMTNMAYHKYQDGSFPPVGTTCTMASYRPNIRFVTPTTTPPSPATISYPQHGGIVMSSSVELQWLPGTGFPTGYKVYAGTTNPPPFVADVGGLTSYNLTNLENETTYYWQIVPYNDNGDATNCPVWSFESGPGGIVLIGNPASTTYVRFPWGHLYGYERGASIYTMDEIGGPGIIDQLGWYCATTGSVSTPYKIYLGTTDQTTFTGVTYDALIANMTLVKQGNYTFSSTDLNTFTLDVPYIYTGGNLVVAVETNYGDSGTSGYPNVYYTATTGNMNMIWYADSTPPSGVGTVNTNRPNIMMHLGSFDGPPQLSVNPSSINFGDVIFGATVTRNVMLANIGGGSITINPTDISLSGDNADLFAFEADFPIVLESAESYSIPITITGTTEGIVTAVLTVNHAGESFTVDLSGNVLEDGLVTLGDGTVNNYLPVNAYYGYTYSQTIYTVDEIQNGGRQIEKIAYHWNGAMASIYSNQWEVWMGHTPNQAFTSTTGWIPVDELMLVYEGELDIPAINQWIEILLPMPFVYNGEDNLVIAVRESRPSYDSSSCFFYTTSSYAGRSLRFYSDSELPNPQSPPVGTLVAAYPNIRIHFGDVSDEPSMAVTPSSLNFGTVFNGAQIGPRNITVYNVGGGTLTLNATDVSITGADADAFSFDATVFPFELNTGQYGQIPVYVQSTQSGIATANLVIQYGTQTAQTELSADILPAGIVIIGDGTLSQRQPLWFPLWL